MALPNDPSEIVLAVGALGAAAQALVDSSKIGSNGGLSDAGFEFVELALARFLPGQVRGGSGSTAADPSIGAPNGNSTSTAITTRTDDAQKAPVLADLLHANWINGMKMADQKAAAKACVKLYLTEDNAPIYAAALGMTNAQGTALKAIAMQLAQPEPKVDDSQHNLLGQFDLMLNWVFDEAYQRADQAYRNQSKVCAMGVAVVLAVISACVLDGGLPGWQDFFKALVVGLIATPLAPVSKDLASALQAAVKAIQVVKK